jgi:shikimate dehydrogenase
VTQIATILGYPLKHSLSPVFQQAAFDHCGLEVRYEAWEVPPEGLAGTVSRLKSTKVLGANVTVPHKVAVMPLLDSVEDTALGIGAVNTVMNWEGELVGHNTDVAGFLRGLREEGGFDPKGKNALLLGAGGAARAVAFGLLQAGASRLVIVNRGAERAQQLAQELVNRFGDRVEAHPWGEKADSMKWCQLAVNATTLGMLHSPAEAETPIAAGDIPEGALIYDLVYNPLETPLLREARRAGAGVVGGLTMLIYQGAAAFEMWTGRPAPVDIMFQTARRALS